MRLRLLLWLARRLTIRDKHALKCAMDDAIKAMLRTGDHGW